MDLDMMVGLITQLGYVLRANSVMSCARFELEYGNISSHEDDMQWICTI